MTDHETENAFELEAKKPLPHDLRLLAVEFDLLWDGLPLSSRRDMKRDGQDLLAYWSWYFDPISDFREVAKDETTLFGKKPFCRVRVDVLATKKVLQTWTLLNNGKYDPRK